MNEKQNTMNANASVKNRTEIKRVEDDQGFSTTYWSVYQDGARISDFDTFRKAWNCAKKISREGDSIGLDDLDI